VFILAVSMTCKELTSNTQKHL